MQSIYDTRRLNPGADTRRWLRNGAIALAILASITLIELVILLVD